MSAIATPNDPPLPASRGILAVRWTARIWGVLSIALLAAFAFGPNESFSPTGQELLGLILFPGLVVVGLAAGWRWEAIGGAVAIGGLAGFYIWHRAVSDGWPGGPYFALFTAPAALFLICHVLSARQKKKTDVH